MPPRKNPQDARIKLLVAIIGKNDEEAFVEACNNICVSLHFAGIGFGTAKSNYRSYLGIDEAEKRVAYALFPAYCEHALLREIIRHLQLYLRGKGICFTIPLSGISNIIARSLLTTPYREDTHSTSKTEKEKGKMHELILAVVNQKYTEDVLDSARNAGATGATLLHTRSIGNEQAEQLIGTSIEKETDPIAILTNTEFKQNIMEAIRDRAGLKTEGGAILLSLPVDSFIGIGRLDTEDE